MPRKAAPEGANKLAKALFLVSDYTGGTKRGLARTLGISYYRANQIVEARKNKTPVNQWIGIKHEKIAEKRAAELQKAFDKSGWTIREGSLDQKLYIGVIPPKSGKGFAKTKQIKKFKNGTKYTYDFKPGQQYEPLRKKGAEMQIIAQGQGRSHGKKIKNIISPMSGNIQAAMAKFNYFAKMLNFRVSSMEVMIIVPKT